MAARHFSAVRKFAARPAMRQPLAVRSAASGLLCGLARPLLGTVRADLRAKEL